MPDLCSQWSLFCSSAGTNSLHSLAIVTEVLVALVHMPRSLTWEEMAGQEDYDEEERRDSGDVQVMWLEAAAAQEACPDASMLMSPPVSTVELNWVPEDGSQCWLPSLNIFLQFIMPGGLYRTDMVQLHTTIGMVELL